MPITISQVLDLLMGLVLIMFVPIGLWRGALREWLTLAGIALGGLLAASWGSAWGDDLSGATGLEPSLAAFAVAAAFFLGTTLIVGYGGGVTLPYRPDLSGANRALGALIGLGNGTLILSGLLQLMQRHLFAGRADSPLKTAELATFLIDSIGWVHLGLLLLFLGCILTGLVRRATEGAPLMDEYDPFYGPGVRGEQPPPEVWKPTVPPVKPTATVSPSVAAARAQERTAVLQIVPHDSAPADAVPADATVKHDERPAQPPTSAAPQPPKLRPVEAAAPTAQVVDIARRQGPRASPPPLPANVTSIAAHNGRAGGAQGAADKQGTGEQGAGASAAGRPTVVPSPRTIGDAPTLVPRPVRAAHTPERGTDAERGAAGAERACPSCGTPAAARSRFCLICGHIIGEPEKRQVARHP